MCYSLVITEMSIEMGYYCLLDCIQKLFDIFLTISLHFKKTRDKIQDFFYNIFSILDQ